MDNCSIHKTKEIESLLQAVGANLIYLPPYSPDFSPIENRGVENQEYTTFSRRQKLSRFGESN